MSEQRPKAGADEWRGRLAPRDVCRDVVHRDVASDGTNPTRARLLSIGWQELSTIFGAPVVAGGERHHARGCVRELGWTGAQQLVATVRGHDDHRAVVALGAGGDLVARCSCPVGNGCEHAVAAILALREASASGRDVPSVDHLPVQTAADRGAVAEPTPEQLTAWLRGLRPSELIAWVLRGAELSEAVARELWLAYRLACGDDAESVAVVAREIDAVTSVAVQHETAPARGEALGYAGLEARFTALRAAGLHDELLDLGLRLFERGAEQIDAAGDGGETGMAIHDCLAEAFAVLDTAQRPLSSRIRLAFDLIRRDGHGIVPRVVHDFVGRPHGIAVWSEVADRMLAELGAPGDMREFAARFRRREQVDQIVVALDRAERGGEATDLLRREAPITRSFVRLVDRLAAAGEALAAQALAAEGLARLGEDDCGEYAGLQERLRRLADERGDHATAAAYFADAFFRSPSVRGFFELLAAAQRAACEPLVRRWAEHFLATGRCPVLVGFARREGEPAAWPLPSTGEQVAVGTSPYQGLRLLRDIAIEDGDTAAVLRRHDRMRECWPDGVSAEDELHVARAVEARHPQRAIESYCEAAERLIAQRQPQLYTQAVALLRRAGELMGPQRRAEWLGIVDGIRGEHVRKRRLVRELDRLTRTPL